MPRRTEAAPLLFRQADEAVSAAFDALSTSLALQSSELAENAAREMLRPMLKTWLDENLAEHGRAAGARRNPARRARRPLSGRRYEAAPGLAVRPRRIPTLTFASALALSGRGRRAFYRRASVFRAGLAPRRVLQPAGPPSRRARPQPSRSLPDDGQIVRSRRRRKPRRGALGGGGRVPRRPARAARRRTLLRRHSAAQRHRQPAHGPRAQQHAAGHPRAAIGA